MATVDRFRSELSAALSEVTQYVRTHSDDVPTSLGEEWKIRRVNGEKALDRGQSTSKEYSAFLWLRHNDIQSMTSFKTLFASIRADDKIARLFCLPDNASDAELYFLRAYFIRMTATLLKREEKSGNSEQATSSVLKDLDDFLTNDTYATRVCAPLMNFRSSVTDAELADGIFLRSVSDATLESFINSMSASRGLLGLYPLMAIDSQLEAVGQHKRVPYHITFTDALAQEKLQNMLKVLRLIKAGGVGYSFTVGDADSPLFFSGSCLSYSFNDRLYGGVYEFSLDDTEQAKKLYASLNVLEKDPRFSLAVRRFTEAYTKPIGGDRLVDYWIGLESLLLPEEKEGELSFRAALRGSWLLDGDTDQRKKTFAELRKSYGARSAVVHGTQKTPDEALVLSTEEYLRRVLRWCLVNGKTPSSEMLNSLVIGASDGSSAGVSQLV
jgi:hypothetical protein